MKVFKHIFFSMNPGVDDSSLPMDDDGVVRNAVFVGCGFHSTCSDVAFEDCLFLGNTPDGNWVDY